MQQKKNIDYDQLLSSYFSGSISEEDKKVLEEWKNSSEGNRNIFDETKKLKVSMNLLSEIKGYNTTKALSHVHKKILVASLKYKHKFIFYCQRIAAILFFPVLIAGAIYFIQENKSSLVVWQNITTSGGVRSQFHLSDGTEVYLNSCSSLKYPSSFTGKFRDVKLKGEAFFHVTKNKKNPFIVHLGKINVKVVGTKFDVINYDDEKSTDVILTDGKVKLMESIASSENKLITEMKPGQKAVYKKGSQNIILNTVDPEKYISWIKGQLIFKDDSIKEVVKKLNRWFNVKIKIADPEISNYIYTATFQEETIEQIINFLCRTSPIRYTVIPGKRLKDGSYGTKTIILNKKYN